MVGMAALSKARSNEETIAGNIREEAEGVEEEERAGRMRDTVLFPLCTTPSPLYKRKMLTIICENSKMRSGMS